MTIELAYCSWGLTGPDEDILERIAAAGMRWVDLRAGDFTAAASQDRLRALGLRLSCLGAAFGMPPGAALDSADAAARLAAVGHVEAAVRRAHALAVPDTYVIPGKVPGADALARYAESLVRIADLAAGLGIRVSIEHFPATALPTIAATLDFLRHVGHANLFLLLDIGHAQMSQEDAAAAVAAAGARLGYVHLDDNDGVGDLHLALGDGRLTAGSLQATFAALTAQGYHGRASLELHPELPDPVDALVRSRAAALAAMTIG